MPFRAAFTACAALLFLTTGATAVAAAPAGAVRADSRALSEAVFARAPKPATGRTDADRFASWRPEAERSADRERAEAMDTADRPRSDVKTLSPGTAMHAGFRVKF